LWSRQPMLWCTAFGLLRRIQISASCWFEA
jgi:hypothetical protein